MGQHKTNPTALAVKQGALPPKDKQVAYQIGGNMDTKKVIVKFNRQLDNIQMTPEAAEELAGQVLHAAKVIRGEVKA